MRPRRDRAFTLLCTLVLAVVVLVLACNASAAPAVSARLQVATRPETELAFDPASVIAPAHVRVSLTFTNASTMDHNLVLLSPLDGATDPIVPPGASDAVEFDAPGPGTYRFVCSIHEDMSGTLEIR